MLDDLTSRHCASQKKTRMTTTTPPEGTSVATRSAQLNGVVAKVRRSVPSRYFPARSAQPPLERDRAGCRHQGPTPMPCYQRTWPG